MRLKNIGDWAQSPIPIVCQNLRFKNKIFFIKYTNLNLFIQLLKNKR